MLNKNKRGSEKKAGLLTMSAVLTLVILVFSGCSAPIAGRLQDSPEVTQIFKNSQILSDHRYYIAGDQRLPYAIIAIDNSYQLRTSRWRPIDLESATLNVLIYRMDQVYSLNPRGAYILDHESNRLGVWFSSRNQTRVKREKDNRIVIVAPDPPDLRGIP